MLQLIPHGDGEAPARDQDARHLAQRLPAVAEEHQAELADHRVERTVIERQRFRAALAKVDARRELTGDRDHSGIEVERRDRSTGPHSRSGLAGHDARATGDVEDALAGTNPRGLDAVYGANDANRIGT